MNEPTEYFVGAVFDDADDTNAAVEVMIKYDFPMDQLSILHDACNICSCAPAILIY
jgi:hypothetical protein